ncbi:hypothetical protein PMI05_01621 [Brevibacillus sp. BC25]|nr:hypothetical protein PMI05_01621 [Brevibacillus sp. BC25]
MIYNDLEDFKKTNLLFFLDKAGLHELNKLKVQFHVKPGRSSKDFKNNVVDALFLDQIPLTFFIEWLSHIHLEGNNMLFIFESTDHHLFDSNPIDQLYTKTIPKITPIYELNTQSINDISLVNVKRDTNKNQLIFTLAAPSKIIHKDVATKELEIIDDIYLCYITMDYDLKHFVLMMHPTDNLYSLNGEERNDWDDHIWLFMHKFKNKVINFKYDDPDWVTGALIDITEEYFHHNNPLITQKLTEFETSILSKAVKQITANEPTFKRADYMTRISKSISRLYEKELVNLYKVIEKEKPFDIFLHKAGKDVTEFKANARGNGLSYAQCAEIVRLIGENSVITTLGIIHKVEDNGEKKKFPYSVSKTDKFYSLKRTSTATTVKEVVDDVLRKLTSYKQEVQPTFAGVGEVERRTEFNKS